MAVISTIVNEVPNPSFEVNTTGWSGNASTISRVVTTSVQGVASCECLTNGTSGSGVFLDPPALGTWAVGNPVSTAVWVKAPIGASMQIHLTILGGGNTGTPLTNFVGTGNWELIKVEGGVLVGPVTSAPYIFISRQGVHTAATFHVDMAAIYKNASAPNPFDGSTPSSPGFSYVWNGAANSSTSTQTIYESIDTMGPGRKMWFGTEKRMQAVPMPATGMQVQHDGVYSELLYDSGRLGIKRSMQTHQRFNMDFPVQEASGLTGLDVFQKYATGFYGDCDSYPIFFADPMNYDQNLFPPNWAAPGLIERGWANIGDETSGLYYNLATNPSVEIFPTNWAAIAGTSGVVTGARTGGTFASGKWCWRVTWTTATTVVSGGLSVVVGVVPSSTGNFRIAIHPSKTQRLQMSVVWLDAGSSTISTVTGTARVMTTSNELPMEMLNLAAPSNAVTARIEVKAVAGTSGTNWAIGDYIEGDAAMSSPYYAPSSTPTMDGIPPTYFDGDTPGAEWAQYAHQSTSSMFVPSVPPVFSDTPANSYELPPRQATIQVTSPANSLPSYASHALIPVPPGYVLWLGATGSSASAVTSGIRVWGYNTPSVESAPVTTATLTMLSSTGAQRLNYSISGDTVQFVKVFINRTTNEAGSLVISSMMAQLWPVGITPPLATSGKFIEGKGHRGLKFADGANVESYVIRDAARVIHYKGMSTQLVEAQDQG